MHNLKLCKRPQYYCIYTIGWSWTNRYYNFKYESGEYTAYDVKSKNYRKQDYQGKDGYKRNSTGSLIQQTCNQRTKETKGKNNIPMKLFKTF